VTPSAAARSRWGVGIVLCVAGLVLVRFVVFGKDWELLATKHYFDAAGFYYGGYANEYVETRGGLRAIQSEALSNYHNLRPLAESAAPGAARERVRGFPGTERVLVPFLLSFLLRVNVFGQDVWVLFLVLNVVLWALAIVASSQLARVYFGAGLAPVCAALLAAVYPAFTLTFHSIKVQPIGTVYLLAGAWLYERRLRERAPLVQVLFLAPLFYIGQFAGGGWLFLAVFLVVRALFEDGGARWRALAVAVAAVILARVTFGFVAAVYDLPSVEKALSFSYLHVVVESGRWLRAFVTGQDVSSLSLLNYRGYVLFSAFLPHILSAFAGGHVALLVAAGIAAILEPRARLLLAAAAALFLAGHAGMMMSAWHFHYGYLSAPGGVMTLLAAAGGLARLAVSPRAGAAVFALLLTVTAVLTGLHSEKRQAHYYFDADPRYLRDVLVCHAEERPCASY
jgi:hypothetical protein